MKSKLISIVSKLKHLASLSPFIAGLVIGYFGHGVIKATIDTLLGLVKLVLKV